MVRCLYKNMTGLLVVLFLGLLVSCSSSRSVDPVDAPVRVETDKGKIQGAQYRMAKPRDWNRKILLIAPGYRPPEAKLVASLEAGAPFEFSLLKSGWLIATTSYRRTGLIIEDGIKDLQNLVQRIEKHYGPAEYLVIEGSSMGGAMGVLISEGNFFPEHLKIGVLAIGVGLEAPGETGPLPLTHKPQHPLLLLSNRSEWASPLNYVRQSPWSENRPVLWYLERDGHVNVNSAERLLAVEALQQWLESGVPPDGAPPFGLDVTVDMSDRPTTVEELSDGYRVKVTRVDPIFGNIDTDMVAWDLEWMKDFSGFGFDARAGAKQFIHYGRTYSDVPPEQFVAFLNAEGFVRIAKNMGNAAKDLKCQKGDYLDITGVSALKYLDTFVPRCPEEKKKRRPPMETSDQK